MQRKFVLLELEAPDPETRTGGGLLLPMENWIWQDILDKMDSKVIVHNATVMTAQYCASCDSVRDGLADFLCRDCRSAAIDGYATYQDYLDDRTKA